MKKILTLLVLLSFATLMACVSVIPIMTNSDTRAHVGCAGTTADASTNTFCSAHNQIDSLNQSSGIWTILDVFTKVASFAIAASLMVGFLTNNSRGILSELQFAFGPPSTSYLLHRKTVVIRP